MAPGRRAGGRAVRSVGLYALKQNASARLKERRHVWQTLFACGLLLASLGGHFGQVAFRMSWGLVSPFREFVSEPRAGGIIARCCMCLVMQPTRLFLHTAAFSGFVAIHVVRRIGCP